LKSKGQKAFTILEVGMQNGTVGLPGQLVDWSNWRSRAVHSERSWKRPVLPLLVPFLNPFSRAKGPVVLGKFFANTSIIPFGIQTPVVLDIASKTMPCLVCCREAEVSRCCFYLNLRHLAEGGGEGVETAACSRRKAEPRREVVAMADCNRALGCWSGQPRWLPRAAPEG